MRTLAEQIQDLQNTRAAKLAANTKLMNKAADAGETLSDDDQATIDENLDHVERLDADLLRLERQQKMLGTARPVQTRGAPERERGSRDRASNEDLSRVDVLPPKREKGVAFARYVKCIGLSALGLKQGHVMSAHEIAKRLYGDRDPDVVKALADREMFTKAPVLAGSTVDGNWAANLVGDETGMFADFVEFLRPSTILGKFGQGNVPSLRRVPFRVPLIGQTAGGRGYWVGEGKPKPVTSFGFDRNTLEPKKVANIVVATMELIRDSSPSAEILLRDGLRDALRERMDTDFINPAQSAGSPEAGAPASITNGVSAIASSGPDADAVRADVKALFAAYIAANNPPQSGVWIMPATVALALSLMTNALGQNEFPGITMNGGTFFGMPVIVSEYVPTLSAGAYVFLVNASDIYLADDGDIQIDMSQEASLQMLDNPTNDSVTPTPTTVVSLWQTNSVGFRAERTINWERRRDSGVAALDEVNWGNLAS